MGNGKSTWEECVALDWALGKALETSSNYSIGGWKVAHERDR